MKDNPLNHKLYPKAIISLTSIVYEIDELLTYYGQKPIIDKSIEDFLSHKDNEIMFDQFYYKTFKYEHIEDYHMFDKFTLLQLKEISLYVNYLIESRQKFNIHRIKNGKEPIE